jgi:protein-tyrosine-phosphatase
MDARPTLTTEQILMIRHAATRLQREFSGTFNAETIERYIADSQVTLESNARLTTWLPLLVERFTSAGDRRRRYVRLVRGPLAELGIRPPGRPDRRVVFVCSKNSARSQLAAALWTARTGTDASSAGTHPAPRVHPGAVAAARRAGLDLHGATPTSLDPDAHDQFVVTVCDRAHEELDVQPVWWHWSIPDPVEAATDDAFDAAVSELDQRINTFDSQP